jgi:hypothetical protein
MGHIFWNEYFRLLDSGETVDVLAIGDSWFHYPFNNLITPLYEVLERPTIFVIGENGARADELAAGAWLANLGRVLVGYPSIRLVCISAGGNDFAGIGDLDDKLLKLDCSGEANAESCYRAGQPGAAFAAIGDSYQELVNAIAAQRPDMTVLVHNYDYAIPDGRALPGVRSWLKLPMDNCRIPTQGAPLAGVRRELVRDLIDRFTLCLDDVVAASRGPGRPSIELVWSAGTLANSQWANELHPRPGGFARVVNDCWSGPARRALGLA